jgi:AcrR family transcriptional regulator
MITSRAASSRLRGPRRPRRSGRPTLVEAAQLDEHVRESALQLFLERGYEGTSMDAVARAAGTTKVSLYARFAGKEDVFLSVLQWATRRTDWPKREPPPPDLDDLEGALTTIAEAAWRRAVDPAMIKLGRIAVAQALRFPEIARQTHAAGYSPRHQLLIDLLKRHAAKGSVMAEDPEILAEHFLAMVSAMPARLASFGIVQSAPEQRRRIELAVRLFLRSLLVRNPNAASPPLRGAPSASSAEMSR